MIKNYVTTIKKKYYLQTNINKEEMKKYYLQPINNKIEFIH